MAGSGARSNIRKNARAAAISPKKRKAPFRERNCSVARTINIVSDAWGFLIIREAFFGARNFVTFRKALDIPRATLVNRLSKLTAQGILRKKSISGSRHQEYRLTKMGYSMYPSFMALKQFGDKWLKGKRKEPLTLYHRDCGCECEPIVACSQCLAELNAREVSYRDGPGAGKEIATVGRATRRASNDGYFLLGRPSSVSRALQIIGDKWSFMVMREAFFGSRRYEQFQSALSIAPNILSDRLSRFVEKKVFSRRLYSASPERYEYVLTEMGRDLYGPCIAMLAWGDEWLSKGKPPLILTHRLCGRDFNPVVVCDKCKKAIHAGAMEYRLNYNPEKFRASTNEHWLDKQS